MKILSGKYKKVVWTSEDLSKAFSLRIVGRKSYEMFKNLLKYPLPHIKTLDRYSRMLKITPGNF